MLHYVFVCDVHKEQRGGRSREHKILYNFANDCAWFSEKEIYFP